MREKHRAPHAIIAAICSLTAVLVPGTTAVAAGTGEFCGPGWQRITAEQVFSRTILQDLDGVGDDLWAVGVTWGRNDPQIPLIERWNGSRWKVEAAPTSLDQAQLFGVHRVNASDAWAVGSTIVGGESHALALRWNGASWHEVPVPSTGPADELMSVDGSGPSDVWAVGGRSTAGDSALIVHWNGSAWSNVPAPVTGIESVLTSVSVVSPTNAWAVGARPSGGGVAPLTLHWNGANWAVVTPPAATSGDTFEGADTTPDGDLWAAGGAWDGSPDGLLAHRASGTWTTTRSPSAVWNDVTALGDANVWTAGDGTAHGWSGHWDGSRSLDLAVPPARGPNASSQITGIEAVSPDLIWLVGTSTVPNGQSVKPGSTPMTMRLCPLDVTDAKISKVTSRAFQGTGTLWRFPASNDSAHDVTDALGLGAGRSPLFGTGARAPGTTGTFELDYAGAFAVEDTTTGHTSELTVPTEALPKKAALGTKFSIYTSSFATLPSSLGTDIRYRKPGSEFWYRLVSGTTSGTTSFTPGQQGVFTIQARLKNKVTGVASEWSPFAMINVTAP